MRTVTRTNPDGTISFFQTTLGVQASESKVQAEFAAGLKREQRLMDASIRRATKALKKLEKRA